MMNSSEIIWAAIRDGVLEYMKISVPESMELSFHDRNLLLNCLGRNPEGNPSHAATIKNIVTE